MAGFGCGGLIIPRYGELMVAGSQCGRGGLIIVRCGELMVAEVITWCGGINVEETCSVLRAGAYSLGLEALGLHR